MNTRFILRFAASAAILSAGCGGESNGEEIEAVAVAGERVVVELGGAATPITLVPGVVIAEGRLEWTPAADQEGEHVIALEIVRDGDPQPVTLRMTVAPVDGSVEYGGCECGSRLQL